MRWTPARLLHLIRVCGKLTVHGFGSTVLRPLLGINRRSRIPSPDQPVAILYVTLAYRGDLILGFPTLAALKRNYSKANITLWVRDYNKELAGLCNAVTDVIAYDSFDIAGSAAFRNMLNQDKHSRLIQEISAREFDVFIDDSGVNFTTWVAYKAGIPLRIGRNRQGFGFLNHFDFPPGENQPLIGGRLRLLKPLGIDNLAKSDYLPRIALSDDLRERVKVSLSERAIENGYFTIQPLGGWDAKNWLDDRVAQVVESFAGESRLLPVFLGSASQRDRLQAMTARLSIAAANKAGQVNLTESAALIAGAQMHFGVDSIGAHLAAATGTPSLTIFGPTNPLMIEWVGLRHAAIMKRAKCAAPQNKQYCCYDAGRRCRKLECMEKLSASDVLAALVAVWKGTNQEAVIVR